MLTFPRYARKSHVKAIDSKCMVHARTTTNLFELVSSLDDATQKPGSRAMLAAVGASLLAKT
ncbi:hypothetical protein CF149_09357 [Pseudomonas psychrophila]|nr:hypothetical protein CF149_09357 [Pseudomonas psychrophila]